MSFIHRISVFKKSALPALLFCIFSMQGVAHDDRYIKINRSIELFGRVYQEIINNYVDEIDPEYFMRAGIEGMLGALDPYTIYIDDQRRNEVDLLTTGRYGGVGLSIGMRGDRITVTSITEGYSAAKQGIMIGDRILSVDLEDISSMRLEEIRSRVRGEPGTTVELLIEREGYAEPITFALTRESIRVRNVSYAEFLEEGIVYLRLERFSRGAGGEVRNAFRDLRNIRPIDGVILDVRDNSGGLLEAAVEIVDLFVPRRQLIVSTKGRASDSVRRYTATQEPFLKDVPLVVLVNGNSASASEIVAGAIQDLDRGVILGTRSFGKGLVQTVSQLSSKAQLKITTSRYYTPSGRSIQAFDYVANAPKGLFAFHPDSLIQSYRTAGGRVVMEGQGIDPDTIVTFYRPSSFLDEINNKSLIFLFATEYVHRNGNSGSPVVNNRVVEEFEEFLKKKDFTFRQPLEIKIDEITELAHQENINREFFETVAVLQSYIDQSKKELFSRYRDEIIRELTVELAGRYNGERGKIEAGLRYDPQLKVALDILKNRSIYYFQLTALE